MDVNYGRLDSLFTREYKDIAIIRNLPERESPGAYILVN
jgi:hypothetical protein